MALLYIARTDKKFYYKA